MSKIRDRPNLKIGPGAVYDILRHAEDVRNSPPYMAVCEHCELLKSYLTEKLATTQFRWPMGFIYASQKLVHFNKDYEPAHLVLLNIPESYLRQCIMPGLEHLGKQLGYDVTFRCVVPDPEENCFHEPGLGVYFKERD